MDKSDKIIRAVHSRPPLWDTRDKHYHSRDIQKHLWATVAKEVGSDVRTVKIKWKRLRDSFRKKTKTNLKSGQAAPNKNLSSWPFYRQMSFLSDIMEARVGVPLSDLDDNCSDQQADQGRSELNSEEMPPPPSAASNWRIVQVSGAGGNLNKRTGDDDRDARLLALEEATFKLLSENTAREDDSDNQFLRSLLPFLKNVPDERKLIVRHKLMQILIDEQNDERTAHEQFLHLTNIKTNCNEI